MVATEKTKDNVILEEAKEILEVEENIDEEKNDESVRYFNEKDYIERLQRLQAEFENFQKRTEKEKREIIINANANLIFEFLEVLDNFELSLKHNEDKGVRLIYEDLVRILEKQGLKTVNSTGKFNPEFHEAIMQEKGKENAMILEEFSKGYLLNGRLLRASKVKISITGDKNE